MKRIIWSGACSVQWCDWNTRSDSFSTDNTLELAQRISSRIGNANISIQRARKTGPYRRQLTNGYCWWMPMNALHPELKTRYSRSSVTILWLRRLLDPSQKLFHGKRSATADGSAIKVIRLFKRDTCRYEEKHVHAEIITTQGKQVN